MPPEFLIVALMFCVASLLVCLSWFSFWNIIKGMAYGDGREVIGGALHLFVWAPLGAAATYIFVLMAFYPDELLRLYGVSN